MDPLSSTSRSSTFSPNRTLTRTTTRPPLPASLSQLAVRDPALLTLMAKHTELLNKRIELVKQQKRITDDLHRMIADPTDGLAYHTERTRRNVIASISVARQMGYFKYYVPPPEVERMEQGKLVNNRVKDIHHVQNEINTLDEEIKNVKKAINDINEKPPPPVNSLVGWFATYERPDGYLTQYPGYATEIRPSKHRYGGTKHYPSFASVSSRLVVGRAFK